jgi:hypothetical protein
VSGAPLSLLSRAGSGLAALLALGVWLLATGLAWRGTDNWPGVLVVFGALFGGVGIVSLCAALGWRRVRTG